MQLSVVKNAAVVSVITLISRVFGYIRDVVVASYLGTGPLNDAFIAAFKFSNLFRNVFGEGAMTSAFVPIFTHKLSLHGTKKAIEMASLVQSILALSLLVFCGIIILFMPYVLDFTTPGFLKNGFYFDIAVEISRIMFPYLFFISLAAFYGGILHSIGKFMPFAATSVIFNISMILFATCFDSGATKAHSIAFGVVLSGLLEFAWMVFFLKKNHISLQFKKPSLNGEVMLMLRRMGSGIFGSGITQINTWIDMIILSFIPGGMSYIYYADRIMQLPLALIATATSTALLPALSKYIVSADKQNIKNAQDLSLRVSSFFLVPSAVFLCVFPHEIIAILLERGHFDTESSIKTAEALRISALGLPAFALMKLFTSNFHAYGDTKTPVKVAFVALIVNITLSIMLIVKMQHVAVSIGSSAAAWIAAIFFIRASQAYGHYKISLRLIKEFFMHIFFSVVAAGLSFGIKSYYGINLILIFALGGSFYLISLYIISLFYKKRPHY